MRRLLALGVVVGLAGLGLSACSSSGKSNTAGGGGVKVAATSATAANPTIQMDVLNGEKATTFGIVAPDARGHDTFVPAHITAQAGQTYTMKVYNYDEGGHSFTIDALSIDYPIDARVSATQPSVTTFTVTFPTKGTFRFYCKDPCDKGQGRWAMLPDRHGHGNSQDGFMAGYVTVI